MPEIKFAAAIVLAVVLLASCGNELPGSSEGKNSSVSAYKKKETYFHLPVINGRNIDLEEHAGKPVLLLFFAEYCPHCQKAAPFIKSMYSKYTGELVFIGIGVEGKSESARFAAENNLNFPVAYNGGRIARKYHARGVPYIYILDKDHNIMDFWAGYDSSFDQEIISSIKQVITKS